MKIKYLIPIFFIVSSFFASKSWAQDPEFSQFYAAPSHLNPAMIGFSSEARVMLNYRHQYPSFGNAFLTLGVAYDQHFNNINSSLGISILADRAGGLLNTYYISGLYAYQLQLSDKLLLKAGAQVSFLQQSVAWDQLVFGDMINPSTGISELPTGEVSPDQTTLNKVDFGAGLLAYTDRFYAGASFKHITRPSMSYTGTNTADNRLDVRSTAHLGHVFYLGDVTKRSPLYFSPNIMYTNQGKFNQINVGSYVGKGVLMGGAWVRHTINNMDALIVMLGLKAGIFKVGYSYDLNLGQLGTNANAHELSLSIDFGQSRQADLRRKREANAECPEIF